MEGEIPPADGDLDDLAVLERYGQASDRAALLADRRLRIQTLRATLEMLREEQAMGVGD